MSERWRSKENPEHVIVVIRRNSNTVSVCGGDDTTVFYLTQAELEYNFEPLPDEKE